MNCRAVIGYGPLIIEFADVMTNRGMGDSYQTSRTEGTGGCGGGGENLHVSLRDSKTALPEILLVVLR